MEIRSANERNWKLRLVRISINEDWFSHARVPSSNERIANMFRV